jgi:acetyl esterase/lipase
MDLYLWLISGDEAVEKILGFHPKEIVLSGDSCGGNLAAGLLLVLNDLRLQGLADISLMPRSLALLFPKLSIRLELQPSTCLSVMDPLINLFVLLRVGQAYAPATHKDSDGVECLTSDVPHDYYMRQEYDLLSTPYTSPHLYEHLDSLSDVHLNVMALHFDPLLDESIRLCKRWQGPVNLQVVDETCHGALIFRVLYPPVGGQIVQVAVSLIQKSFSGKEANE